MARPKTAIPDDRNAQQRDEQIMAILNVVKQARDDVRELNLKFEAYLLDMAVLALAEQAAGFRANKP